MFDISCIPLRLRCQSCTCVLPAYLQTNRKSFCLCQSPLCRTQWPGHVEKSQRAHKVFTLQLWSSGTVLWNICTHSIHPTTVSVWPKSQLIHQAYHLWEPSVLRAYSTALNYINTLYFKFSYIRQSSTLYLKPQVSLCQMPAEVSFSQATTLRPVEDNNHTEKMKIIHTIKYRNALWYLKQNGILYTLLE